MCIIYHYQGTVTHSNRHWNVRILTISYLKTIKRAGQQASSINKCSLSVQSTVFIAVFKEIRFSIVLSDRKMICSLNNLLILQST